MSSTGLLTLHVDSPATGAENMRRDTALLDACARGGFTGAIRLYAFSPPCLSVGRLQPDSDVDWAACARDGVDVVRRPSGGRAVLHDQEVTYAVVCRATDPQLGGRVLEACARIHAAIAAGLTRLGIVTVARASSHDARSDARAGAGHADCFSRPAVHELLDRDGRKLAGSAQARRGGALLQHGSVLLDPPRTSRYLLSSGESSGASSGVRALAGRTVTTDELASALAAGFAATLGDRLRQS